ncbi:hypothetical protein AsGV032 [Agrotis segetum granulovirus]|uniref:Uncharacterized protein n=1 Tax=Agrotis segetum granulosis virus TaxID=10464 RepID=A0A023MHE2_GVAS|nr:hypothetical protein AsGV032 [Agrotis segetum granulovirus]AHN92071.1 hypothetical protein AsGV032 [Agrotis segetum granulovirus]AKN63306.1 hypothetical protein AsGV032 [Agrotis segetum granulovirus]
MDFFYLIHETSFEALSKILQSGFLLTSSKTQKLKVRGQGSSNRRLASDPRVSLTDSEFFNKYDEVDGVYMRLQPKMHSIRSKYSDCVLVLRMNLLKYCKFVINSEENFGFYIAEEGVIGTSQFSGEPGFTTTSFEKLALLKDTTDYSSTEVLILQDVPVSFIKFIFLVRDTKADTIFKPLARYNIKCFNIL